MKKKKKTFNDTRFDPSAKSRVAISFATTLFAEEVVDVVVEVDDEEVVVVVVVNDVINDVGCETSDADDDNRSLLNAIGGASVDVDDANDDAVDVDDVVVDGCCWWCCCFGRVRGDEIVCC